MSPSRFIFLDLLRIFAALSVFFGHNVSGFLQSRIESGDLFENNFPIWMMLYLVRFATEKGGSGVIVFFLISGYIIYHSIISGSARTFLIRRIFRIYPAFILASLLESYLSDQIIDYPTLMWRLTLLGDVLALPYGLGGVEWTLRIELYYYVFMYLAKWSGIIENRLFVLIFLAPTFLLFAADPLPRSGDFLGYISLYIPILFMGSCIYIAQFFPASRTLGICVMFICYMIHVQELVNFGKGYIYFRFLHLGLIIWFLVWYFQSLVPHNKIILLGSNVTYSFYLLHNWLAVYISEIITNITSSMFIYFILVLFCVSIYYLVERPFIFFGKLLTRYFDSSRLFI